MVELTPQRFRALTKEKIRDIAKNNPERLVGLIDEMRGLVKEQVEKLGRRNLTPFAFESLMSQSPEVIIGKIPQNTTSQRELAIQLLNTYKAKSMTVKGSEKIAKEQDKRIFGISNELTSTGLHYRKINYRMSPDERRIFWDVYNEIANQAPIKSSETVLQEMKNEIVERVSNMDLSTAYSTLIVTMADNRGLDQSFINDVIARIKEESGFRYS